MWMVWCTDAVESRSALERSGPPLPATRSISVHHAACKKGSLSLHTEHAGKTGQQNLVCGPNPAYCVSVGLSAKTVFTFLNRWREKKKKKMRYIFSIQNVLKCFLRRKMCLCRNNSSFRTYNLTWNFSLGIKVLARLVFKFHKSLR